MLAHAPSPVQRLQDNATDCAEVTLLVKRDDLLHPLVSGNKWRKLKYNLEMYSKGQYEGILSFGGAYSNHLYALSAACHLFKIPCTFYIRGEQPQKAGFTLQAAHDFGTKILWLSREEYHYRKNSTDFLQGEFAQYYIIPEGGSNPLGVLGLADLVAEVPHTVDYWVTALGTGGTLAGLARAIPHDSKALGISCLKGNGAEEGWVKELMGDAYRNNYTVLNGYEHGGYAKVTAALVDFMNQIYRTHTLKLDPVYTAKTLFAVYHLMSEGYFEKNSTILFIHTGGLQGLKGIEEKLRRMGLEDCYFEEP